MSGGFGGENGGFSESAASLTFHDPDDDNEVGIDTQADDFRFNFTLPSQDFQIMAQVHSHLTMTGLKITSKW